MFFNVGLWTSILSAPKLVESTNIRVLLYWMLSRQSFVVCLSCCVITPTHRSSIDVVHPYGCDCHRYNQQRSQWNLVFDPRAPPRRFRAQWLRDWATHGQRCLSSSLIRHLFLNLIEWSYHMAFAGWRDKCWLEWYCRRETQSTTVNGEHHPIEIEENVYKSKKMRNTSHNTNTHFESTPTIDADFRIMLLQEIWWNQSFLTPPHSRWRKNGKAHWNISSPGSVNYTASTVSYFYKLPRRIFTATLFKPVVPCSLFSIFRVSKANFKDVGNNVWGKLGRTYWVRGLGGRVWEGVKLIHALMPDASADFFQSWLSNVLAATHRFECWLARRADCSHWWEVLTSPLCWLFALLIQCRATRRSGANLYGGRMGVIMATVAAMRTLGMITRVRRIPAGTFRVIK